MRIAIEARALQRPGSGITTYVRELLAALREIAPQNEYMVLDHGPSSEVWLPAWLNTTVPRWLAGAQPNLVHFTKAALPRRKRYPTVVTIYDVIPLLYPESQKVVPRLLWPATLRHAAAQADHILTISEASKRDIVDYLQVAPAKVTATPLAVSRGIMNQASRIQDSNASPYILFLGTIEPRKNVPALVRAFAAIASQVPHRLVIAGRSYKGIGEVQEAINRSGRRERIELRDFIPAEELPALYAGADLFVWPSLYEGWGFPPLEAMAAGVPVIVSNGGSLPEVVGKAGEVVPFTVTKVAARTHDGAFEEALRSRMLSVVMDRQKHASLKAAGLARVHEFSWAGVARATLQVYEHVSH